MVQKPKKDKTKDKFSFKINNGNFYLDGQEETQSNKNILIMYFKINEHAPLYKTKSNYR